MIFGPMPRQKGLEELPGQSTSYLGVTMSCGFYYAFYASSNPGKHRDLPGDLAKPEVVAIESISQHSILNPVRQIRLMSISCPIGKIPAVRFARTGATALKCDHMTFNTSHVFIALIICLFLFCPCSVGIYLLLKPDSYETGL